MTSTFLVRELNINIATFSTNINLFWRHFLVGPGTAILVNCFNKHNPLKCTTPLHNSVTTTATAADAGVDASATATVAAASTAITASGPRWISS